MAKNILDLSITKIVDLNEDCLESIFEHLKLPDLISIIETNKRFSSAARNSFYRKYKNTWIYEVDVIQHEKLIQYFGQLMRDLKISGKKSDSIGINIDLVIKYFHSAQKLDMVPFERITNLEFNGIFESEFAIDDFCTHIQNLRFVNASINPRIITKNFPTLESLTIQNHQHKNQNGIQQRFFFTNEMVKTVLTLNRQLQSLSLDHDGFNAGIDVTADLLQFIQQTCPLLRNLYIIIQSAAYFNDGDNMAIFEQLEKCTLVVSYGDMLNFIPVRFRRIETLVLEITRAASKKIFSFILQNQSLRNLRIEFSSSIQMYLIDYNDIITLTKHPNVENMFIQLPVEISGHNIVQFVSACQSVKKLNLKFVRSGGMIIPSQNSDLFICTRNDFIDLLRVEAEMDIIRESQISQTWDWNTSINYIQNNIRNYIDTVELSFRRKKSN